MNKAIVISAFPACGKSTYYREWSQYSRENVWRKMNNGEQVLNNIGLPCGKKILASDSSEFNLNKILLIFFILFQKWWYFSTLYHHHIIQNCFYQNLLFIITA